MKAYQKQETLPALAVLRDELRELKVWDVAGGLTLMVKEGSKKNFRKTIYGLYPTDQMIEVKILEKDEFLGNSFSWYRRTLFLEEVGEIHRLVKKIKDILNEEMSSKDKIDRIVDLVDRP